MKQTVWLVYLGGVLGMLMDWGWVSTLLQAVFWLTIVAHFVEFLMNRSLFEKAGGSMGHHFVQTMIYGLFHWQPIKRELEGASAPNS